jgi:hypothetical protein
MSQFEANPILSDNSGDEVEETMDAKIERLAFNIAEKMMKEREKVLEEREKAIEEKINIVEKMTREREKVMEDMILERLMKKMSMDKDATPPPPPQPSSSTKATTSTTREYNQMPFEYPRNSIPFVSTNVSSSSLGKVPILEGSNYDEWANKMKYHLFSVHPSLWEIVNVGLIQPKDGGAMTPEWMQDLHRNAQAVSIILGSVCLEEYNKISGYGIAKVMWDTLRESHEGDSKSKKGMIEVLEGELGDFTMLNGETLQSLYDRLMVKINKIRSLGSDDWNDNKVTRLFLRAYQIKDKDLARMIRDRDDYELMKPHQLLAKLKQHEIADEAATKTASRVSNAMVPHGEGAGKGIALQANKVKMVEESSCEEESSSEDEESQNVAILMKGLCKLFKSNKRHNKSLGDKDQRKERRRGCYECGDYGHFIVDCPKKKQEGKKEHKKEKHHKGGKTYKKKRHLGHAHIGEEWVSGEESSSSEEGGIAGIAIQRTSPTPRLFTNLTNEYYSSTCLMAKEAKVYSSDESSSSDFDEPSLEKNMIEELGINAYNIVLALMEKLDKRKRSLEGQEELLILEIEKTHDLKESLSKREEMLEALTRELSLAKATIEEKEVELAKAKSSMVNLEGVNLELQSNISSLLVQCKDLEARFSTSKNSNSSTLSGNLDSSPSTSKGCKKCYNLDLNACATNLEKVGKLEKENKILKMAMNKELFSANEGFVKEKKKPPPMKSNQTKRAFGYDPHKPNKVNPREEINGKSCLKFNKGITLFEAMNKVHTSTPTSTKEKMPQDKGKQAQDKTTTTTPISRSYACDYVVTCDQKGNLVIKYVGAHTKRKLMKRSVWVPKVFATNSQGPKSFWGPTSQA